MRRLTLTGLALLVVLALSAMVASAAFAEDEWLVNGSAVTETAGTVTEEIEVVDKGAAETAVLCSRLIDNVYNFAGGVQWLLTLMLNTELLTPSGLAGTGTDGEFDMVECTLTKAGMCKAGTEPHMIELRKEDKGSIELSEGKFYLNMKEVDIGVECVTTLGVKVTDTCEGLVEDKLENGAAEVLGTITLKEDEELKDLLNCSIGGAEKGAVVTSSATKFAVEGSTLAVS